MYPTGNGVVDLPYPVGGEEHDALVVLERAEENTDKGISMDILD
jgi:hypothetical protein